MGRFRRHSSEGLRMGAPSRYISEAEGRYPPMGELLVERRPTSLATACAYRASLHRMALSLLGIASLKATSRYSCLLGQSRISPRVAPGVRIEDPR